MSRRRQGITMCATCIHTGSVLNRVINKRTGAKTGMTLVFQILK